MEREWKPNGKQDTPLRCVFVLSQTHFLWESPFLLLAAEDSQTFSFSCIVYKRCVYRFISLCVLCVYYMCCNTKRTSSWVVLTYFTHSYWIKQFFMRLRLFKWSVTKWKQSTWIVYTVKERLRRARLLTRSHPVTLLSLCRCRRWTGNTIR